MKTKQIFLLMGCSVALMVSGCASYTIQPISGKDLDKDWKSGALDKGFVFYQSELYFLVTPAPAAAGGTNAPNGQVKNPGVTVTPVFLPNPQKPYRVTTFNFLAKSDFAFNFKDGWQLQSIADKADNTTVANTLAGELGTILGAAGVAVTYTGPKQNQSFLLHPEYNSAGVITGFSVAKVPVSD